MLLHNFSTRIWPARAETCSGINSGTLIILFSGLLRSIGWLSTDVSGQPIGSNFKVQLTLDDGTDRLSQNVGA